MAASEYRQVHVDVTQKIGSAFARFRPWPAGRGAVTGDHTSIGLTTADTFVPADSPIRRYSADALGRTLADIMLPACSKGLLARTAATAIVEAVRSAPPGVTVADARELHAIVQAQMPQRVPKAPRIR